MSELVHDLADKDLVLKRVEGPARFRGGWERRKSSLRDRMTVRLVDIAHAGQTEIEREKERWEPEILIILQRPKVRGHNFAAPDRFSARLRFAIDDQPRRVRTKFLFQHCDIRLVGTQEIIWIRTAFILGSARIYVSYEPLSQRP